jgi:HEPN domain-containing protein
MTPLGREWVRKAESDRRAALKLWANPPVVHGTVCFRSQQLAEKYLKALLHERGRAVPRTHDCEDLIDLLAQTDLALGRLKRSAAGLSRLAVNPRYPGFHPTPSRSHSAWNAAERIRAEIRRRLGLRPLP